MLVARITFTASRCLRLSRLIVRIYLFFLLLLSHPVFSCRQQSKGREEEEECVCSVEKENKSSPSLLYTLLLLLTITPTSKKKLKKYLINIMTNEKIAFCGQLHPPFTSCFFFFFFYVLLTKECHDYTTYMHVCVEM